MIDPSTTNLLDEIRRLIEAWEDENSPLFLRVKVVSSRPGSEVDDEYRYVSRNSEWHHYERSLVDD